MNAGSPDSPSSRAAPRVAIATLGCRVNFADSMQLEEAFRDRNATLVPTDQAADIYVVNSCTVTHAADSDARKLARRFKRHNPAAQVVVTGCYAQVSADALEAIPEIDRVIGNDGKDKLADVVLGNGGSQNALQTEANGQACALPHRNKRSRNRVWNARVRPAGSHITALPESRTRPFLKVQDGCDYSCSFCIIPRARGVSRSSTVDEVFDTAMRYADLGASELVLTGIHLGHWGRDLTPRVAFSDMVAALADKLTSDGRIRRLRLGSVEPNEVTDDLVALWRDHPLLARHAHIPLQSGDDGVLKRMRRLYTVEQYRDVIARLRTALPDAAIGADVLVGHPGEDDDAYANTRGLIESLDLTYLHVFPFSARRDTPSAAMTDVVDQRDKSARVRELIALSDARLHFFHRRFVGKVVPAIVLDRVGDPAQETAGARALTDNYIPVRVAGDHATLPPNGAMIDVVIDEAGARRCMARAA